MRVLLPRGLSSGLVGSTQMPYTSLDKTGAVTFAPPDAEQRAAALDWVLRIWKRGMLPMRTSM